MMVPSGVVILGAGGLGREVLWALEHSKVKARETQEVLGYVDDNEASWGRQLCGKPVLGGYDWFNTIDTRDIVVISAVGSPKVRRSMVMRAETLRLRFCTVVHSSVEMSEYVEIGVGTTVTAGCILTANIRLGNHVFLNLDSTVGHDVAIEDFVNVAPGCHISGNVLICEGADLGTGAVVLQGKVVGKWSVVGAGAVVTNDVPDGATVVGVPARVIKGGK